MESTTSLVQFIHPAETSPNSAFFKDIRNFCLQWWSMRKYEAYINGQDIWYKNNTEYLYLILRRA